MLFQPKDGYLKGMNLSFLLITSLLSDLSLATCVHVNYDVDVGLWSRSDT